MPFLLTTPRRCAMAQASTDEFGGWLMPLLSKAGARPCFRSLSLSLVANPVLFIGGSVRKAELVECLVTSPPLDLLARFESRVGKISFGKKLSGRGGGIER